jgi:hypothetical protein
MFFSGSFRKYVRCIVGPDRTDIMQCYLGHNLLRACLLFRLSKQCLYLTLLKRSGEIQADMYVKSEVVAFIPVNLYTILSICFYNIVQGPW